MRKKRSIAAASLLLAALSSQGPSSAEAPWVNPPRDALVEARSAAGLPALERHSHLDRVARERAEAIAELPHAQRLVYESPIAEALRRAGISGYLQMRHYMNMVKGYRHPGVALARQWKTQPSWRHVLDPDMDAFGMGAAASADGWIVLIVVFIDDGVPYDGPAMERAVVAGINAVREEHGLGPLAAAEELSRVARAHSEDMARRDYVEHRNPEGLEAGDRLRHAGVSFRSMGENLHMSRGHRDPVAVAVGGWMQSKGHRRTILTTEFVTTGVGVARGADGGIYVTQLFLQP